MLLKSKIYDNMILGDDYMSFSIIDEWISQIDYNKININKTKSDILLGRYHTEFLKSKFNNRVIPTLIEKERVCSLRLDGLDTDLFKDNFFEVFVKKMIELDNEVFSKEFVYDYYNRLNGNNGNQTNENEDFFDNEIIDFMNKDCFMISPLVDCSIIMLYFLSFGCLKKHNGIISRLLISFYLRKHGYIDTLMFFISDEINIKTLDELVFKALNGGINEYINYFLECCINYMEKTILKLENIEELYITTSTKLEVQVLKINKDNILDFLFKHPIFNSNDIVIELKVSLMQANRYISKLQEINIIESNAKKRYVKYWFKDLINIIFDEYLKNELNK